MNAEPKKMYLTETTLVLNREGFHAEILHGGKLGVWLDDKPLCEISDGGAVHYHSSDIPSPNRIEAKDRAYQITCTVFEYMRLMESAPPLKAVGLEDQYKLLAEFNGTVLAGMHSQYGVQFVTWERDHDGAGLHWGHYFSGNYNGAKQDFATRAGLISEQQLFKDEQLIEIYRCCADTLEAGLDLTHEQEKCIKSIQEQIENGMPDIMNRIREQNQHTVDLGYGQEQKM